MRENQKRAADSGANMTTDYTALIERLTHEADAAFEAGYGEHEDSLREAATALRELQAKLAERDATVAELRLQAITDLGQIQTALDERDSLRAELAEANKTDQPCEHHPAPGLMIFVKTLTTQQGTVFVCEKCSKHWFRTYAALALGSETQCADRT